MPLTFPGRKLLALPLMAPLFGCADGPAGQPIVLRPPHPEKQAHRAVPRQRPNARTTERTAASPSTAPAEAGQTDDLTPEEKESLFRDFDNYLRRSSP